MVVFAKYIRFVWGLIFIFCSVDSLRAQSHAPPEDLCATVSPITGNIELTWIVPPGVLPTATMTVFQSTGGAYTTVGSYPVTNPTHIQANSNGPVQFYIRTTGIATGEPSDTVSTIFLNLAVVDDASVASLSWNAPFGVMPPGEFSILRSIEGAPEEMVAVLPNTATQHRDTLYGLCADPPDLPLVSYRVVFNKADGSCEASSQIESGHFADNLAPQPPQIETVLIDPATGQAYVYWYPSPEPDVFFYLIQQDGLENIDTVYVSEGITFGVYPFANGEGNLNVIAYDECGNEISYDGIFNTITTKATYVQCDQTAEIVWDPYNGWDEGVSHYNVMVVTDGQDPALADLVATVEGSVDVYDMEITPNVDYGVYIEAFSNGIQRSSTSNLTEFSAVYPPVISFNYLNRVTTIDRNTIQIDLLQDNAGQSTNYELFRARGSGTFKSLGVYGQTENALITVLDEDVNADSETYTYKWRAFDGCGQELWDSNTAQNILLFATTGGEAMLNQLSWNSYENWDGDVEKYEIYRKLGSEDDFSLHETVETGEFSYSESVEEFMQTEGEFCYFIRAVEGDNQYFSQTTSESNISCLTAEPVVWIPNAIVINGINRVFKPVASFIDFETYRMQIINKWGQELFYSENVDEGWDGTHAGSPVREDYYKYIITYRNGSGKPEVRTGVVYVLEGAEN